MTEEERERLALIKEMTNTEGWRVFVEQCEEEIENLKNHALNTHPDHLGEIKGQAQVLYRIINLRSNIEYVESQDVEDAGSE